MTERGSSVLGRCAPAPDILRVALPMYPQIILGIASGLWAGILVARTAGTVELAGYGMGVVFTNRSSFAFVWGATSALLTVSSQSYGALAYHEVGIALQRAVLVFVLLLDLPLVCVFLNAERLLAACGQPLEVARIVGGYALVRVPGLFFATMAHCMFKTVTSIGRAHFVFAGDLAGMATNVLLSLLLIPRMGVIGAAVASVAGDGAQMLTVWALAFQDTEFQRCWPGFSWEAWTKWCSFIKLAVPATILMVCEVWISDAQTFISGYISTVAQATQAVVPQFTTLMYGAGLSTGTGGAKVIGNFLGAGQGDRARWAAVVTWCMAFCLMVAHLLLFTLLRGYIPHLYTDDPALIRSIALTLPFCLCWSFVDGLQSSVGGILTGVGWQSVAAPVVPVCYGAIGFPFGLWMAFRGINEPWHLQGLWIGMIAGVSCHLISYLVIALCIHWDHAAQEAQARSTKFADGAAQQLLPEVVA